MSNNFLLLSNVCELKFARTHLVGMSIVPPLMIMITALDFLLFNSGMMIMIVMFMAMIMGAFFMSVVMRMPIITLHFHVGRGILVVMMFVTMVVSALLMTMIMCMSVVVVIILELRYFRFEISDGRFQFGNICLDGDCRMGRTSKMS